MKLFFVFVISSNMAIDLFFMFSSFFVSHQIIRIAREYNGLSFLTIIQIYLGRLIRIVPLYYFVFITGWVMIWYLGSGPLWMAFNDLYQDCNTDWWTVILMVNNFFPTQRKYVDGCMTWGFFVSVELQLFIFLPLIILMYRFYKYVAVALLCILTLGGAALSGFIIWYNNFIPGYLVAFDGDTINQYVIKPYVRIEAYCMGILLAMLYDKILWYK